MKPRHGNAQILGATSLNEILLEHRACLGRCLVRHLMKTGKSGHGILGNSRSSTSVLESD